MKNAHLFYNPSPLLQEIHNEIMDKGAILPTEGLYLWRLTGAILNGKIENNDSVLHLDMNNSADMFFLSFLNTFFPLTHDVWHFICVKGLAEAAARVSKDAK